MQVLLLGEFSAKKKAYLDDWADGFLDAGPVVMAALELFSTSLLTSIAFGLFYSVETDGQLGVVASLASGGITGVIQGVIGGNPMTLSGQTGPVALVYVFVYEFAHEIGIPFLPFIAWIGVWIFVLHFVVAVTNLCEHRTIITPFTAQIFESLVASDFITTGLRNLAQEFYVDRLNGILSLFLAGGFFVSALTLAKANKWAFFSRTLLRFVHKLSSGVALILWVILSWIPSWTTKSWPTSIPNRPDVQTTFGLPTEHNFLTFVDMGSVSLGARWAAIIPALIITVLFYVDHNISSMAAYNHDFPFKKAQAYNLDFLVLGFSCLITGLMGLPASSGLIPQNPLHSRALLRKRKTTKQVDGNVERSNENIELTLMDDHDEEEEQQFESNENETEELYIIDQRVSGLIHSLLLFVCIFLIPIIGWIPTCLIWGYFLVLASEAFHVGNEFLIRVLFLFTSAGLRETWSFVFLDIVPFHVIVQFTLIQLCCFACVYILAVGLTLISSAIWTVVGVTFPVAILLFAVPLRSHILPKLFLTKHLAALDSVDPLVRVASEVPVLEKDPDEDFVPYIGRGAPGREHVLNKEQVREMFRETKSECESNPKLLLKSNSSITSGIREKQD